MANPALPLLGYNPGSGTGHTHAVPDLTGWQDTYQHIGPGATSAAASGVPFATCTKLFDVAAGYPNFPTAWTGAAQTIANNNGGVPVVPMMVWGSGPGPSTQPVSVATIVTFLTSIKNNAAPGQRCAFNFISEAEAGTDGLSPSQYVTNWEQTSANLNQALLQMGGPPFWTRANFPFITAARMDHYQTSPGDTSWLPHLQHVDAYGADFYQRIGGTQSVGAQSDPRFQGWLQGVYARAGTRNVPLALPEYGIGFVGGAYTAALEAGRAQLLQKDFAYFTGSSRPSGTAPLAFWLYWYQMDTGQSPNNIYCFPLAPSPSAGETQAQAIATINVWQSIVAFSQGQQGQNTVTVTNPGTQNSTAGQTASLQIIASDSNPALGLTYGASADMRAYKSAGLIVAQTNTRSPTTGQTLRLLIDEYAKLQKEPIDSRELRGAQDFMSGSFPLTIETPSAIAEQVLGRLFYGQDLKDLETYRDRVEKVTVGDITRVSREFLKPDQLSIVLVGDASAFADDLKALGFTDFERIPLAQLDLNSPTLKRTSPTDRERPRPRPARPPV